MPHARYALVTKDEQSLVDAVAVKPLSVAAQRLFTGHGATVVGVAIDGGAELKKHTAKVPILIQAYDGDVVVGIDDEEIELPLGGIIQIDANVVHSVKAARAARIVLTLLSAVKVDDEDLPGPVRKALPVQDVTTDAGSHGGHDCTCAEQDEPLPELDVRSIPHAIRHATVFGAFDGLAPGKSMVLVAHHDPVPLLMQMKQRYADGLDVAYGQRGPEVWKLQLTKSA